ncbi:hypothetical protein K426_25750 (plasmid) [Sphingobium sp. TKS]|nr:hypothetical protein K426_25750 [Sphingobium sp. TKS]
MTGPFVARGRIFSGPLAGATAHVTAFVEGGHVGRNSLVDADASPCPMADAHLPCSRVNSGKLTLEMSLLEWGAIWAAKERIDRILRHDVQMSLKEWRSIHAQKENSVLMVADLAGLRPGRSGGAEP